MKVTRDKFELPIAVADTAVELAQMTGNTAKSIYCAISRKRRGWAVVEIPEEDEENE